MTIGHVDYGFRARLEPLAITGAIGPRENGLAGTRAIIALVPGAVLYFGAVGFHLPALAAALIGGPVAIFVGFKIDKRKLSWLMLELGEAKRHPYFEIKEPLDSVLASCETVSAGAIQAGMYVVACSYCNDLTARNQRLEDWNELEDVAHGESSGSPPTSQELVSFAPVVAIHINHEVRLVVLGMAEKQKPEKAVREDERFYLLSRDLPSYETVINISSGPAVSDLMETLPDSSQEDLLVAELIGKGYAESEVQHVIDSAFAMGLVRRVRSRKAGFEPRISEAFDIFRSSRILAGGHKGCALELTEIGQMWLDVGKRSARASPPGNAQASEFYRRHRADGHAFISYVREDGEHVDRLQRILEGTGVKVWRDTTNLWPGQDWRAQIRQAISSETLVFLACFSGNSAQRSKTYQNEELLLAIDQIRLRRPDVPWLSRSGLTTATSRTWTSGQDELSRPCSEQTYSETATQKMRNDL